jgi:hypothetical protein
MNRYALVYGPSGQNIYLPVECDMEPSFCENPFCDSPCNCGYTFDEAKDAVIRYYEEKIERLKTLSEEEWENI